MQESNGSVPSTAPDFSQVLAQAQATGDFDFVLETAKKSHKMLVDFRDAIQESSYPGSEATSVAMGLNFLENMISNSVGQLNALKQTEKATREAMKAQPKAPSGPEKPAKPSPPEEPAEPAEPEEPSREDPLA